MGEMSDFKELHKQFPWMTEKPPVGGAWRDSNGQLIPSAVSDGPRWVPPVKKFSHYAARRCTAWRTDMGVGIPSWDGVGYKCCKEPVPAEGPDPVSTKHDVWAQKIVLENGKVTQEIETRQPSKATTGILTIEANTKIIKVHLQGVSKPHVIDDSVPKYEFDNVVALEVPGLPHEMRVLKWRDGKYA